MATSSSPKPVSDGEVSRPPLLSLDMFDILDFGMEGYGIQFADAPLTYGRPRQIFDIGDFEAEFFRSVDRQNWHSSIDPTLLPPEPSQEGLVESTASPPLVVASGQATNKVLEFAEPIETSALSGRLDPTNEHSGDEEDGIKRKQSARRRLKPHDWDKYKPLIRRIYMIEDNSLSVTRQILKDGHGFEASEKGFKAQFRVWKWEKNLKKPAVDFMLQKLAERKIQGKGTRFRYRGTEVPDSKLQRHSKGVIQVSNSSTISGVSYYTPMGSTSGVKSYREPYQSASDLRQSFDSKLDEILEATRQGQDFLGNNACWDNDVCGKIEMALAPLVDCGDAHIALQAVLECKLRHTAFDSIAIPLKYFTAQCLAVLGRYAEGEVILDNPLRRYNQISTMDPQTYTGKILAIALLLSKVLLVQNKLCTLESLLLFIQQFLDERSISLPSNAEFLLQRLLNIAVVQQIDLKNFGCRAIIWRLAISFHHEKLFGLMKKMVQLARSKNVALDQENVECLLGSLEILRRYYHEDDDTSDKFLVVLSDLDFILSQASHRGSLFSMVLDGLNSSYLKIGCELRFDAGRDHWFAFANFKRMIVRDILLQDWAQLAVPLFPDIHSSDDEELSFATCS